jgi:hypothetical protein
MGAIMNTRFKYKWNNIWTPLPKWVLDLIKIWIADYPAGRPSKSWGFGPLATGNLNKIEDKPLLLQMAFG